MSSPSAIQANGSNRKIIEFNELRLRDRVKGSRSKGKPINCEHDGEGEHGPEDEFVGGDAENDGDEDSPDDGDDVDEGTPFAEVPGSGFGGDPFAFFAAAVAEVEVNGDDVGEVKGDDRDGGDDVEGGGVNADEDGEDAGDDDGVDGGAEFWMDLFDVI
jgi:hypothetical protein